MSFKKEIRQRLEAIEGLLAGKNAMIREYELELSRMREQNASLLDRIMSVDYEKFRTWTPPEDGKQASEKILPFGYDENMAGEIVEGEGEEGP